MSKPDQSKGNRSRDEVLAGEYVLGVLSAENRAQVELRLKQDRQFAAMVHRWEENLSQFNDDYSTALPRPDSFSVIETRLFGRDTPAPSHPLSRLWHSTAVWRGVALVSVIALASLAGLELGIWEERFGGQHLVADLKTTNASLSLLASYNRFNGRLRVTPVATSSQAASSLELWMIEASGKPHSLGVLPQTGEGEFLVSDAMRGALKNGVTLAVSIEPLGGSPNGLPTGPVIGTGVTHAP
ncbi:anti-sigma factor [Rhizobium sp.]|jgi:anti-sigma-K factor RskA|uniref:anti-sigma factor n=1 Tax=Rhizobium sp. TaxID=391 RepID=UPI000E88699B|nr:anti-sigma factor [Rhizobium sp.]